MLRRLTQELNSLLREQRQASERVQAAYGDRTEGAEILIFARRREADWELRRVAQQAAGKLGLYPYSLMSTRRGDPDSMWSNWD